MKNLKKILMVTAFFSSFTIAFCAYAEKTKAPEVESVVVSEGVSVAPAGPPAVVEKSTLENLQIAFNGENNARARYLAFAKKADEEGYSKVATLFRAIARAEQVHFDRDAKVIKELGGTPAADIETPIVKSTSENLETAMDNEIYESTVMYPEFLDKAERDNIMGAIDAFEDAGKAEAVHAGFLKSALGNLPEWKNKGEKFYVCVFCGNVVEKVDFKECPVCGKSRDLYVRVR